MLAKEDRNFILDASCYAERHIHSVDSLSYLLFLVDSANEELCV